MERPSHDTGTYLYQNTHTHSGEEAPRTSIVTDLTRTRARRYDRAGRAADARSADRPAPDSYQRRHTHTSSQAARQGAAARMHHPPLHCHSDIHTTGRAGGFTCSGCGQSSSRATEGNAHPRSADARVSHPATWRPFQHASPCLSPRSLASLPPAISPSDLTPRDPLSPRLCYTSS